MTQFDEAQARTIDAVCKIATAVALVVAGSFTAYSYVTNRTAQTRSAAIEAKKPFLQKQLDFYVDVSSAVAVLVTSKDSSELETAKKHFWNLYWGPLRVVEDIAVSNSMDRIAMCLDKNPQCDVTSLKNLDTELTGSCSVSLRQNWEITRPNSPTDLKITLN
jgi:hypothetical protein